MITKQDIKLSDVEQAVELLHRKKAHVTAASVHKILGRGSYRNVKKLLGLVLDPAAERLSRIEYSDSLIVRLLSENSNLTAGVPGQLVDLLDEVGQLHDRLDETFDHVTRILSLVQTVILENLNAVSETSSEQEKIRKQILELKQALKGREES